MYTSKKKREPGEKEWDVRTKAMISPFGQLKKKREEREPKEAGGSVFYLPGILFGGQNDFTSQNLLSSPYVLCPGSLWKLGLQNILNISCHWSPHRVESTWLTGWIWLIALSLKIDLYNVCSFTTVLNAWTSLPFTFRVVQFTPFFEALWFVSVYNI